MKLAVKNQSTPITTKQRCRNTPEKCFVSPITKGTPKVAIHKQHDSIMDESYDNFKKQLQNLNKIV